MTKTTTTTTSIANHNERNNDVRRMSWRRGFILILAFAVSLHILFDEVILKSPKCRNSGCIGKRSVWSLEKLTTRTKTKTGIDTNNTMNTTLTTISTKSDIARIKNESCQRPCRKRINKILIAYSDKGGIDDRFSVLGHTINIAGYLCAIVEAPKPHQLLLPYHNHGKPLNSNISWSDFGDFQFRNGDSGGSTKGSKSLFEINDINIASLYTNDPDYAKWLHIRTNRLDEIVSHFKQLEKFTIEQQQQDEDTKNASGFIWKINLSYYQYRPRLATFLQNRIGKEEKSVPLLPPKTSFPMVWTKGCEYSKVDLPLHMRKTIDTVFDTIINNDGRNATIGYFHVRRTDDKHLCDSSLDKLKQYINCSFDNTNSSRPNKEKEFDGQAIGNVTILFSSDELDQNYRDSVRMIVEKQGEMTMISGGRINNTKQVKFIDLDNILRDRLIYDVQVNGAPEWRWNNNFYLYSLVKGMAQKADFNLTRHRFSCHECDKISDQVQHSISAV